MTARSSHKRHSPAGVDGTGDRRCIVSGQLLPRARMIRFVVGPDRTLVADLDQRLPGRGLWLEARKDILAEAASGRHFSRALRGPVEVPPDLVRRVEAGLAMRCGNLIGLARRAGVAVAGFEKTRSALKNGAACLLISARDGAADGRGKLVALASGIARAEGLDAVELGAVFGREGVVHVAVTDSRFAQRINVELARLEGVRGTLGDQDEISGAAQMG
jgi:predicted RNA-binding protein YlxR (DUF448 family)